MTDRKNYEATDDDIPESFFLREDGWPSRGASYDKPTSELSRKVAALVHFPTEREKRQTEKREARRERADAKSSKEELTKHYVKRPKILQMASWCLALESMLHVLNPREQDLLQKFLWKFRRYGPYKAKWVTRAQYDFMHSVAAANLTFPGVIRGKRRF
jgi:hypothetical protein